MVLSLEKVHLINVRAAAFFILTLISIFQEGSAIFGDGYHFYSYRNNWVKLIAPWYEYCFTNPATCQLGVSIAFWFKPDGSGDYFTTREDRNSQGIFIKVSSSILYVKLYTETHLIQTSVSIARQRGWIHAVFTYNQTDNATAIYIDGKNSSQIFIERSSSRLPISAPVFVMGKDAASDSDTSGDIDAYIDELAIWQDVLTADDVSELRYGCTYAPSCPVPLPVEGATFTYDSVCPGQDVSYRCNISHRIRSGSLRRTCLEDSTWSGDRPFCGKLLE